jgi:hypothetical protein
MRRLMNRSLPFNNGTDFLNGKPFGNSFKDRQPLSQAIQKWHKVAVTAPTC